MAAQKVVVAGSNISAGQMKDFWRQVAEGSITGEMLQAFLERRNPFGENPSAIFTVTSDGRTGEDFIRDLKQADYRVGDWAADVMRRQPAFVTTAGVTYRLGVIKGEEFSDSERTTKNIRAEAARRGWFTPPAEVAPLLRESVSDEDIEHMELTWLVVMHEPIIDSGGDANLLNLYRLDDGRWLNTVYVQPVDRWNREDGFVFLLPHD